MIESDSSGDEDEIVPENPSSSTPFGSTADVSKTDSFGSSNTLKHGISSNFSNDPLDNISIASTSSPKLKIRIFKRK